VSLAVPVRGSGGTESGSSWSCCQAVISVARAMIAYSCCWPLIGSVAICSMVTCLLAEWGMAVAPRAAAGSLPPTKSSFGAPF
jgi:hypothetical protein